MKQSDKAVPSKPKFEIVPSMSVEALNAICSSVIDAMTKARVHIDKVNVSLAKAYAQGRAALIQGIPSGLGANQQAYDELHRRAEFYAGKVFASGQSNAADAQTIKNQLIKQLRTDGFVPPLVEKSDDEKVLARQKADAMRNAKKRKIVAFKAEIKKHNPKVEDDDLQALAEEKWSELVATGVDKEKQQGRNAKAIEKLVAVRDYITANDCGDGDQKELLAAFVSVESLIKGLL